MRRHGNPVVGLAVHGYYPRIGGSEAHIRWIAESLRARGEFSPVVIAPRTLGDPSTVSGIEILSDPSVALTCDAVFTYTVSELTLDVGDRLRRARQDSPPWLHHPCAVETHGFELLEEADRIVAFNDRDSELTELACGSAEKVVRIRPGAHPGRRGRPGRFRSLIGSDYILWVGAWEAAKGVAALSRRFAAWREFQPDLPLKLVMFGGYGDEEFPVPHRDIIIFDHNWGDVPDAISDCLFVAFNSPAPPLGHDANPLILLEAFLNGKTFLAQRGTPFLSEVGDLGVVVEDDEEWLRAAQRLILEGERRRELERACERAGQIRYTLEGSVSVFEAAVRELLTAGRR